MDLLDSAYFHVTCDFVRRLVVFRRTSAPYATLEEMDVAFTALDKALSAIDRSKMVLLVDSRDAPARNDAAYERAFEPHRRRFLKGFTKVAILVKTASGRLHSLRLISTDGIAAVTFTDEAAAMAHLGFPGGA